MTIFLNTVVSPRMSKQQQNLKLKVLESNFITTQTLSYTNFSRILEIPCEPCIFVEEKLIKRMPGEDVTFKVKFNGVPRPEIKWTVDGRIILPTDRVTATVQDEYAVLQIRKLVPEDQNIYTICVQNDHGTVEDTVELNVMCKLRHFSIKIGYNMSFTAVPSRPNRPECADISSDYFTVFWKAPNDNGQSEITEYILEYRKTDENS